MWIVHVMTNQVSVLTALSVHLCLYCTMHYNNVLYVLYCTVLNCNVCAHVDPHALDWEHPDRRPLVRHEPVKLVPTLVPLDAVELVAVEVVAAHQVRAVPGLHIARDTQ